MDHAIWSARLPALPKRCLVREEGNGLDTSRAKMHQAWLIPGTQPDVRNLQASPRPRITQEAAASLVIYV